jgi:hypothetical protein
MEALLNKRKDIITVYCAVLQVTITYIAQNNKILIPNIKVYAVVLKLYCRSHHFGFQIFLQFLSGIVQVGQLYKPKMQHKHKTKSTELNIYFNASLNLKIIENSTFNSVHRLGDSFHDT